jgi:hypothetical protein
MIVRNERESKTNRKEKDGDHCFQRELAWLPSASSAARRLLLLPPLVIGAELVIGKKGLRLVKI